MPLFVTLGKYTTEALKEINNVPGRMKENIGLIEANGGKMVAFYGLMGEWDFLAVTEFPDEKRAMSVLFTIGKSGRLVTRTMTAVSSEDFQDLTRNA